MTDTSYELAFENAEQRIYRQTLIRWKIQKEGQRFRADLAWEPQGWAWTSAHSNAPVSRVWTTRSFLCAEEAQQWIDEQAEQTVDNAYHEARPAIKPPQ